MFMRISFRLSMLTIGLMLGSGAIQSAAAQTAQQLTNALKPTGTLTDTTRGIKMLPGTASNAAPAAPPSARLAVEFATGSAALTPQATASLNQLGIALTSPALAAYRFKIIGHTDTTGDPAVNQSLSTQRATAVEAYLEDKFNIEPTRLTAIGVGESNLAVPTPPNTPEPRNRLVQIVNLGQ
jgi:outer membrane protein OmpA-like peptidoglycan-associated protein